MNKRLILGVLCGVSLGGAACGIEEEPERTAEATGASEATTLERIYSREPRAISAIGLKADATEYLKRQVASLGEDDRFEVIREGKNLKGAPFVKLAQVHRGVPVWGAEVAVHSSGNAIDLAIGQVMGGLERMSVTPAVEAVDAVALAKQRYLATSPTSSAALPLEEEQARLVILPQEDAGVPPRLVWHVVFFAEQQGDAAPARWNTFVDAQGGDIVRSFDGLATLSQASGPGGSGRVARVWSKALDVEPFGSQFRMDTSRLQTENLRLNQIVTGPLNNIGDAATNDAHGFAEITLDMLLEWQGVSSIDGFGHRIVSRVHYGSGYENAFWDGSSVSYGDGGARFLPFTGSLDVVSHEIHHGFTQFHSNLIYSDQSGGISEAFSDIAGEVTEAYYKAAAPDFGVGPEIARNGAPIRYMCDPRQDGSSIDHFSQYRAGLDVHYSSGIMNKAFCRMARRLGSGSATGAATLDSTRRAGRLFYVANDLFWTAGTTFQQACQSTWDAATALDYSLANRCAIRQSWIDVGVTCGDGTMCSAPESGSYSYGTSNTNNALQNTVNRDVTLAAGRVITLGTCGATGATFTGDTYLRLMGAGATEVASNDDACGGSGSRLTYTATVGGTFQIRGGCYDNSSCTGTVVWSIE